ncbi:hypothetical protein Anas_07544 [Armadillidium nasatum]|uniref:Uncharacterized protein n=1 Tax=Armadillidium nasatum TaxID=96803 RepID=A0A5N5TAP7_9CRUS|nr:hypothetical protein Anas_07544 [Armadillidium nasatum]
MTIINIMQQIVIITSCHSTPVFIDELVMSETVFNNILTNIKEIVGRMLFIRDIKSILLYLVYKSKKVNRVIQEKQVIKGNLEDIVISEKQIPTFGPYTPTLGFQLTSQRNQHRSSCNFSEDFTTIFDLENTRYCALPSREESYRLIPFVEESSVPIEDKMSNPKVFYHLNNLSLLEGASLNLSSIKSIYFYSAAEFALLGNLKKWTGIKIYRKFCCSYPRSQNENS